MARIVYGVMGNTHGHIMRTRAILSRWKGHEFYIIGGGRVPEAFQDQFPLLEVPVLRTIHRNQAVDVKAIAGQIMRRLINIPRIVGAIAELIERWQPDIAICDREFFLPIACKMLGLRCISVDHSHILVDCRYPVPIDQMLSWNLAMLNDRLFFNFTRQNCIVSFFHPPLKNNEAKLFAPVLRPEVLQATPTHGDHILVYQTSPTFVRLIDSLGEAKRPVIVYGFRNENVREGNIFFKAYHPEAILQDLASCAYAIANGGHNLLCEAFFLKKPVLCFPIRNHFEQFLNSWHTRELGYGDFSTSRAPDTYLFERFEKNVNFFQERLAEGHFHGTGELVEYLEKIVSQKKS